MALSDTLTITHKLPALCSRPYTPFPPPAPPYLRQAKRASRAKMVIKNDAAKVLDLMALRHRERDGRSSASPPGNSRGRRRVRENVCRNDAALLTSTSILLQTRMRTSWTAWRKRCAGLVGSRPCDAAAHMAAAAACVWYRNQSSSTLSPGFQFDHAAMLYTLHLHPPPCRPASTTSQPLLQRSSCPQPRMPQRQLWTNWPTSILTMGTSATKSP